MLLVLLLISVVWQSSLTEYISCINSLLLATELIFLSFAFAHSLKTAFFNARSEHVSMRPLQATNNVSP